MRDPLEEASDKVTQRGALAFGVLLLVFAAFLTIRYPYTMAIVGGILLLIMFHEAGHLVAARRAGMKATEFFLGFGPRIWSFRRGETEYGVKPVLMGGYVRIVGMNNLEEVDPADEPRTYRQGRFGRRLAVVLAGVTVNLLIAVFLFFLVFAFRGVPDGPNTTISDVVDGLPAEAGGLESGDRLVSIGDTSISEWDDVSEALEERADDVTTFVVERDGETVSLDVTPQVRSADDASGFVGISPGERFRTFGVLGAARESVLTLGEGTAAMATGLADFFSPSGLSEYGENFTEPRSGGGSGVAEAEKRPVGIIGIVDIGADLVDGDPWRLVFLLANINLVIALFNLLPLLPFDGGHAAIAVYEEVASRVRHRRVRVDFRKLVPITSVVLFFFLTLALSIAYLDIRNAFGS